MAARRVNAEKFVDNRVWVTASRTISTGQFESTKIEVGVSKTYTKDPVDLLDVTVEELNELLDKKEKKARKNIKKKKK